MQTFRFTAFEKTGEILKDEAWEFFDEATAKSQGAEKIEQLGLLEKTHRLVNSSGKLILFHV
ncbi:YhzD family protein [Rummeliibacillus pycnus]|uniref:YhzD family protein n=1 Tax=Rummeliibacillus pycnus TaxID=101070 RepID=UPI000C9D1DF4|nr:YhzD family protein [Rummeliibacillus pycnus]